MVTVVDPAGLLEVVVVVTVGCTNWFTTANIVGRELASRTGASAAQESKVEMCEQHNVDSRSS